MSRSEYAPRQEYVGTGLLTEYTFDFKIEENTQLLVIELDENGIETERVRGDDIAYLSDVTFDEVEGGGTVTLTDALTNNYTLILLQANDSPTQPSEFKEKFGFTLRSFEMALDYVAGAVQRLAYLCNRSVKLSDLDDPDDFDPTLPSGMNDAAGKVPVVNDDSDGWEMVDKSEVFTQDTVFSLEDGQAAENLTDETLDGALYTSAVYTYEILRGTTVLSTGQFSLHYRNALWYLLVWGEIYDNVASGLTLSIEDNSSVVAQLQAALDSGAGDGTLKLKKQRFAVYTV